MSPQCLAIAKDLHKTDGGLPNFLKDAFGIGECGPDFQKCIKKINTYLSDDPVGMNSEFNTLPLGASS